MIVVNNVSSPQRLVDVARVIYNSEYSDLVKAFVITRIGGNVAQVGLPEVSKLAYKLGKPLIILPTVNDAIELFNPTDIYLIHRSPDSQYLEDLELRNNSMFLFSGSDSGFSKNELLLGKHTYFKGFNQGVSLIAEVAITLYILTLKHHINP